MVAVSFEFCMKFIGCEQH